MSDYVDVLVIGSGVAGLSAAIAARQSGAETVMLFEALGVVGGASRLSDGLVVGAGTRLQGDNGIEDSADAMFSDYMNLNGWVMDAGVTRALAEQSGPTVDWLEGLGTSFNPTVIKGGFESSPRCAVAEGRGQGLVDALRAAAMREGVDIVLGSRVEDLVHESGGVAGAIIGGERLDAGAVIVATGGIGSNRKLVAERYPEVGQFGERWWYIGEHGSQGDALRFAEAVGARIGGEGIGLSMLTPLFARENETYQPGWMVLVDPQGERFMPESLHYSALASMAHAHGGAFFAIMDSVALDSERSAASPAYAGTSKGYPGREARKSPNWNPEILRSMREAGRLIEAPTIGDLARRAGLPQAQLEATIADYNDGAAAGRDRFGKPSLFLRPIAEPPFFAAPVEQALIVITGTGLAIDPDARVLDGMGRPIPGLYAAGEAAASVWGHFYPSSGSSLGGAATMGRIAGRHAGTRSGAIT